MCINNERNVMNTQRSIVSFFAIVLLLNATQVSPISRKAVRWATAVPTGLSALYAAWGVYGKYKLSKQGDWPTPFAKGLKKLSTELDFQIATVLLIAGAANIAFPMYPPFSWLPDITTEGTLETVCNRVARFKNNRVATVMCKDQVDVCDFIAVAYPQAAVKIGLAKMYKECAAVQKELEANLDALSQLQEAIATNAILEQKSADVLREMSILLSTVMTNSALVQQLLITLP
jgi:hypothetical protein